MTVAVPFNDAPALERRLERLQAEGRLPACLIMEAAMMNCGVILPEPGYLEEVRRITRKYGVLWIVDEVKTGFRIANGGAQQYFHIKADLATYGKVVGGGMPIGVVAGKAAVGSWETVVGGSRNYVDRLAAPFADRIRLDCGVREVRRLPDQVIVTDTKGRSEQFDHVVMASHADQTVRQLLQGCGLDSYQSRISYEEPFLLLELAPKEVFL